MTQRSKNCLQLSCLFTQTQHKSFFHQTWPRNFQLKTRFARQAKKEIRIKFTTNTYFHMNFESSDFPPRYGKAQSWAQDPLSTLRISYFKSMFITPFLSQQLLWHLFTFSYSFAFYPLPAHTGIPVQLFINHLKLLPIKQSIV